VGLIQEYHVTSGMVRKKKKNYGRDWVLNVLFPLVAKYLAFMMFACIWRIYLKSIVNKFYLKKLYH